MKTVTLVMGMDLGDNLIRVELDLRIEANLSKEDMERLAKKVAARMGMYFDNIVDKE